MKIKKHTFNILFLGLLLLFVGRVEAQQTPVEKRVYQTHHVNPHPPEIDGKTTDPVWDGVEWSGDFTQTQPNSGSTPFQQTTFKVVYDDKNLYVLIRAYDTEPDKITKRVTRRDNFDSDWVGINIDSYFDKRTAFSFTLSAAGSRSDAAISNDNDWDTSWDPVWYGATSIDDQGWIAEMRIPLSQLRFSGDENQIWGFQVNRYLFRKDARSSWQYIPQNAPGWVSLFGELRGITGVKPSRRIELLPYTVGNFNRFQPEANNPFRDGQTTDSRFGLDGKIGLTGNLTMDLTVNPDFGQVEADPSRVNLSAFELFFEERRPFFVEGKNITELKTGGGGPFWNDQLFYSRRIGRAPQRSPSLAAGQTMDMPDNTSILTAAKITGKTASGLSIGIVDAVTGEALAEIDTKGFRTKEAVEPRTNYLVTRLQQDYNGGVTSIGAMFTATNRTNSHADFNFLNRAAYTGGLDFRHQWKDRTYWLNGNLSFSNIRGNQEAIIRAQRSSVRYFQRPDASHVTLDSSRTSMSGHGGTFSIGRSGNSPWNMGLTGTWRSPDFELNDLGFLRQADVFMQTSWIGYQSNNPSWYFRRYNMSVNQWQGYNFARERTFLGGNVSGGGQFNNYWGLWMGFDWGMTNLSSTALRGGPSMKTPGNLGLSVDIDTDNRKSVQFGFGGGQRWNYNSSGRSKNVYFSARYRPSNAMNIRISPFYNDNHNDLQYVSTEEFLNQSRYLLGSVDQKTFGISVRLDYSITPNMSIQYYGQPFISAGRYSQFKLVTDPRADQYKDRFHILNGSEVRYEAANNEYFVDENIDGTNDYTFGNPNFNFRQFRSNLVMRWEYTPGSTLFLVWAQQRTGSDSSGDFSARRDLTSLFDMYPANVFLVKFNHWFSL